MTDKLATVAPSEAYLLFDRQDDAAIIARIKGQALKEYVYSFPVGGKKVYGLGIDGAEACKRELARSGEVIEEDDVKIEREDAERCYFKAWASRWAVSQDGHRIKLDNAMDFKRQAKFITHRSGQQEPDDFWYEKGAGKAMRNAILNLIPEEIKQRVIDAYKGTQHERVVEMTPETADAMTEEAHAAFKDKDARDALVGRLKDRWRELGLQVTQVKRILVAKNLPEVLASPRADWSTVDPAVIQDMLTEAN